MTIHRTRPEHAVIYRWLPLPSGVEVTAIPLLDSAADATVGLFARLTYDDALTVAEREGARLISPESVVELGNVGLQLRPYLGTPTAETSLHHSRLHDEDVWRQLVSLGWDGQIPVSGAGKHWVSGAPPGRSRLMGWDMDGAGPSKRLWQPDMVAHNRLHHDDGTTTMLERGARRPTTIPVPAIEVHNAEVLDVIEARHYTREPRPLTAIRWVVLHSTENPCRPGVARNVARWFAGPSSPQASAHYIVGPDETIACVPLEHAAWAAPGANAWGVQIEMVGQARLTDWTSGPGLLVLERTAGLVAALCRQLELPVVRLDAEQVLAALEPGVTSHAMVTDAARLARQRGLRVAPWWRADRSAWVGGDHQDPGGPGDRRWPWDLFLAAAG